MKVPVRIISLTTIILLATLLFACRSTQKPANASEAGEPETETEDMVEEEVFELPEEVLQEWSAMHNSTEVEINCWGDSITEGYGGEGVTYPDVLERLTRMPTNNFGIGGDDSLTVVARSKAYGEQSEDILIIQMGDNGGWDNIEDLIGQYRELIEASGSDKYIIITSSDDPDDFEQIWAYTHDNVGMDDTWYERRFREAFGDHLLISRKYLIENGLRINGLQETEEDRLLAEKGNISKQLRFIEEDNTHLNADGYTALAHGVYEQGKILGYW